MSSNAPVPYTASDVVIPDGFNESIDLLLQTYARDLTPQEFGMAIASAHMRGLSIVKKQIYFWKQGGKVIEVVGIDGYRSRAEASGEYAGQDGPYWCGDDGVWKDIWLSDKPPVAAKVGVFRRGFQQPLYEIALWAEYNAPNKDVWKKLPTVMLAKCAEARAIRKAFPETLGGTYMPEELDQMSAIETTGVVRDARPRQQPAPRQQAAPRQVTGTVTLVDDDDRKTAKTQLWDLANRTYGWDQETLDAVAVDATDTHLKDMNAAQLRDLAILLATEAPDERKARVERATAIESPQLAIG